MSSPSDEDGLTADEELDGEEPYPEGIEETTQGHPDEPYMDEDLILTFDDETEARAKAALKETNDLAEETYLESLITVIQYHRDPTFDNPLGKM